MQLAPPALPAHAMAVRCREHDTAVSRGLCTVSNYLPALCRSHPQYDDASPGVIHARHGLTRPPTSAPSTASTVYRCGDYRGSELIKE
jgi:hypothetical protein